MTANHEYTPTTFRGPDPTYVVSLKYAAGSRQVKMSPQEIEKAIESIITAAEQRGAAKGWNRGFYESKNHDHVWEEDPPNPYRADQEGDDE